MRIFRHKLGHKWFTPAGNPTIVQPGFTLVDVDTTAGKRHFYELDGGAGKVVYVQEFDAKPLPAPGQALESKEAERAFDEVWTAFDREYANFGLLPKLDWEKLGKQYRKDLAWILDVVSKAGIAELTIQAPGRASGVIGARRAVEIMLEDDVLALQPITLLEDPAGQKDIAELLRQQR